MTTMAPVLPLEPLLTLLAARGHDFRDYRHDVLSRRVRERMDALRVRDLGDYLGRVAGDGGELDRLIDTLLIATSAFFRDPATFTALADTVIPRLALGGGPVRAWVAGSATGEEAWTLAMLLAEHAPSLDGRFEVFASDVSVRALEIARRGAYPAARADEVPASYRHHLIERGDEVLVADALRGRVTFCHHDLLGPTLVPPEAVLARFELVLCRNVLIYLDDRLQERLCARLASTLAPGGVLVLGPFESLPPALDALLSPAPGIAPDQRCFTAREAP
jgi:chemotaxis methyl-accepting protein methylase